MRRAFFYYRGSIWQQQEGHQEGTDQAEEIEPIEDVGAALLQDP